MPMDLRAGIALGSILATGIAFAGAATSQPNPERGEELAKRLCATCHLVSSEQQHALADVPSFYEIANKQSQTKGAIMAAIVIPRHPMPAIPIDKSELTDLAAYIMTLRDP